MVKHIVIKNSDVNLLLNKARERFIRENPYKRPTDGDVVFAALKVYSGGSNER